jgi:hypothetical protein
MRRVAIFIIIVFLTLSARSQSVSIGVGTDIPYLYYAGIDFGLKNVDFTYRTGILIPPYSDAILATLNGIGVDDIYINILDAAYQFGWMNSIGAYYKIGYQKDWYIGGDFRFDWLIASDAPRDLVETVTGQSINFGNRFRRDVELQLGLRMLAFGLRIGKSFTLDSENRHSISTEISINKYISTRSSLEANGNDLEIANEILDDLLWEDVFGPYGYVGGIGIKYSYKIRNTNR